MKRRTARQAIPVYPTRLWYLKNIDMTEHVSVELRQEEFRVDISELVGMDTAQKVARVLLRYSRDHGLTQKWVLTVPDPLTHLEISNLVGTSPEAVTMVLDDFQNQRLILSSPESLAILHPAGLEDLALAS